MAFDKNSPKKMSYPITTLFSSEKNGNEFQLIKIGFYDGKLTFNFYKGVSGNSGEESNNAYVSLDYETACMIKNIIDNIVKHRVSLFRTAEPYDEIGWHYNIIIPNKDTMELRTVGTLTLRTVTNEETGNNTVHIMYQNGIHEFNIALGAGFIAKSLDLTGNEALFNDIDIRDARFYAFAYLINNIIRNWPVLMQTDRMASIIMNRFQHICTKLGISFDNQNEGRYNDKYRSDTQDNTSSDDIPF
jgi:hypothetical protein